MNSAADQVLPRSTPDYFARGLALWPRLWHPHPGRVRRDPRRVATLVSRRTILPRQAILDLLGAPIEAE